MNTYDELQKEMTLTFDTPISFEKKKAPEQVTELDDSVLTSEEREYECIEWVANHSVEIL